MEDSAIVNPFEQAFCQTKRREEMAETKGVLACSVFVLMAVMVNGDLIQSPPGKSFCNCSNDNPGGSTLDYYNNCDAKCQPSKVVVETSGASGASRSVFHILRKMITDLIDQIRPLFVSVDSSYGEGKGRSNMQNSAIVIPLEQASWRTIIKRREEMAVMVKGKGDPTWSPAGSLWWAMLQHLQQVNMTLEVTKEKFLELMDEGETTLKRSDIIIASFWPHDARKVDSLFFKNYMKFQEKYNKRMTFDQMIEEQRREEAKLLSDAAFEFVRDNDNISDTTPIGSFGELDKYSESRNI